MERKGPDQFQEAAAFQGFDVPFDEAEFALLNTQAHPLAYDLQDVLAELLDMDGIYIKGGAIRNMITGHVVDEIDAIFDVRESGLVDIDNDDPEEMLEYIARVINGSEDFEDCAIYFQGDVNGVPILNLRGTFRDMPVDLNLVTHDVNTWGCVYDSGAPILSACMEPNGTCWARPNFQEHLDAGLLIPDEEDTYAVDRLGVKCQNQYGPKYGWTYVHPSQVHKYEDQLKRAREGEKPEYEM